MNEDDNESKVGKKLSEQTTRKVVILVLVMLFSSPVFTPSYYVTEPDSFDYGLNLISTLGANTPAGLAVFNNTRDRQSKLTTPLIYLYAKSNNHTLQWNDKKVSHTDLRKDEKQISSIDSPNPGDVFLAIYDLRSNVQLSSMLSIITTFMVCFVLSAGAMIFSKLTQDLVITPIENMIEKVQAITKDPLKAAHEEEEKLLF